MASSPQQAELHSELSALTHWMRRVVQLRQKARRELAAETIHDLRVALRRCVSMAQGMMAIDPSKDWKQMRRESRRLRKRLGALRDSHVIQALLDTLAKPDSEFEVESLRRHLADHQSENAAEAIRGLKQFDLKHWKEWTKDLPKQLAKVPSSKMVFKYLAFERFNEARALHRAALRNRSRIGFHRLRVALKRFRYTAENFLPQLSAPWSADLKQVQEILGDLHDLDALWMLVRHFHSFRGTQTLELWKNRLQEEREKLIANYRQKMVGLNSLWAVWRAGLPEGDRLEEACVAKLAAWASFAAPNFSHSQRVAGCALKLYDGLSAEGLIVNGGSQRGRQILLAAALMHDVGMSVARKRHHKASYRMIRNVQPPVTWSPAEMQMAAVIARYHRRALPQPDHKEIQSLPHSLRPAALFLGGILRLADALDHICKGKVPSARVRNHPGGLVITVDGYIPGAHHEERLKLAKRLLEISLNRSVLVLPSNKNAPLQFPQPSAHRRIA